jgi:sulfur carrier protein
VIALQINGRRVELERATPVLDYLARLGVDPRAVAVELNGTILDRAAFDQAVLDEGDVVEIVRMVGGGCGAQPLPRNVGFLQRATSPRPASP